jgi:hypothetical protein
MEQNKNILPSSTMEDAMRSILEGLAELVSLTLFAAMIGLWAALGTTSPV